MVTKYVDPVIGYSMMIKIQDQSNAAIYSHPVIINQNRAISFSTKTVEDEVADENDWSAPAAIFRRVASYDTKVDGTGVLPVESAAEYTAWATSGQVRNCKISYANTTVTGDFIMDSFNISGDRMEMVKATLTLVQAGPVTVTSV